MKKTPIELIMLFSGFILLFATLLLSTPHGLAVSPDSVAYIKGASGFLNGYGYSFVSVEWPPAYPTLLIIFSKIFNDDIILGARVLQSFLYGTNFVITALIFNKYLKLSILMSCLLAGLIFVQPPMINIHFYAWSEPSLIFCLLTNIYLLQYASRNDNKYFVFIELSLIIISSIALLTRFAGITVAALNCAVIFISVKNISFFSRIIKSAIQLIFPILVFYPWLSHRGVSNDADTDRAIQFHIITLNTIEHGLSTVGKWFVPYIAFRENEALNPFFVLIGLVTIGVCFYFFITSLYSLIIKRFTNLPCFLNKIYQLQFYSILFLVIYLCFLILALSFVDNKVTLDDRIMAPAFISVSLLIISFIVSIQNLLFKKIGLVILMAILITSYSNFRAWILISYFNGIEMSDKNINNKKINIFLSSCIKSSKVYADNPWNFDLMFQSKVKWLPRKILFNTGFINENYLNDIQNLSQNADLIIIEDLKSSIINNIKGLNYFNIIYSDIDGMVLIKTGSNKNICNN